MSSLRFAERALSIQRAAEDQHRPLTAEERTEVESLLDRAKAAGSIERQMDEVEGTTRWERGMGAFGSPGQRFIQSPEYKRIQDPGSRGQTFTTGAVQVSDGALSSKAGTALESGQGAGLVPVPQVVPGVVEKLFEPLGVADLFATTTTNTSSVRYINEGTATSGAAGVAEGAAEAASDLAYSTVDEPVKKIATSLTTSDEGEKFP